MKTNIGILVLVLCTGFFNVQAQRVYSRTTTRATSYDISDNLDLDAVASIFGDSENLEDFEHRLNDPDNRISNLDLNEDGYIDYLRVVENSSDRNSLVVIQAVLGDNVFQDVATIEVERVQNGNPRVQIVGDPYIYGSNYIIEPDFYRTPLIFSFFWGPRYSPWQSPYYWNYYPKWYSYYRPYAPFKYRRQIYAHINFDNRYRHGSSRNIQFSGDNYNHIQRNDYANRHPDQSFGNRHQGVNNRNELIDRRANRSGEYQPSNNSRRSDNVVTPGRSNSGSGNSERKQSTNEYRRPVYQGTPTQTRTREYNQNSNNNQQQNTQRQVQPNERPATPERRAVSTPQQSTRQVEQQQKSSAPRERSTSVSRPSRPTREARQNQRSVQKSEPAKKETKKESRENRRSE